MMRSILIGAVAVLWVTSGAAAIECAADRPSSGKGHWSWRTVDGKKCWYSGRPGMDKAKLRWAATTAATTVGQNARPERDAARAAPVAADTARDVQRRDAVEPREVLQSNALSAEPVRELTFRERWPN